MTNKTGSSQNRPIFFAHANLHLLRNRNNGAKYSFLGLPEVRRA
jgi:hypothetical protein